MISDPKQKFLTKLETLAEALYMRGDSVSHSESWESKRSFVAGFAKAGLTLSLVTLQEVQATTDKAHLAVYGEERLARIKRLQHPTNENDEVNWDIFDEPAFERVKKG